MRTKRLFAALTLGLGLTLAMCLTLSARSTPLLTSQVPPLTADDGVAYGEFGWDVAVVGDMVVVGAPYHDVGGNENLRWIEETKAWQKPTTALTSL